MRRASTRVVLTCLMLCTLASAQKKIKVIADQDSAGPQGTNFLSLLMLLRSPQIDLLGITTVSGDQWMEPATVFALWGLEQAGRPDVPVIKGAEEAAAEPQDPGRGMLREFVPEFAHAVAALKDAAQ